MPRGWKGIPWKEENFPVDIAKKGKIYFGRETADYFGFEIFDE